MLKFFHHVCMYWENRTDVCIGNFERTWRITFNKWFPCLNHLVTKKRIILFRLVGLVTGSSVDCFDEQYQAPANQSIYPISFIFPQILHLSASFPPRLEQLFEVNKKSLENLWSFCSDCDSFNPKGSFVLFLSFSLKTDDVDASL